MNSNKRGFTLLELLTVIGMIGLIAGALTAAMASSQERARIQKAQADVKSVTQAVLGYENLAKNHELPTMDKRDVDKSSIGFLLGKGGTSEYGMEIPVLLMASLTSGGKMIDPWGTPYRISIRKGKVSISAGGTATGSMSTGFVVPNFYHLTKEERE